MNATIINVCAFLMQCTLLFLLDHLRLVIAQSDRNKMTAQHVALCFGPLLMLHSGPGPENMDFARATRILQYLLDIWPAKSGNVTFATLLLFHWQLVYYKTKVLQLFRDFTLWHPIKLK